MGSTDGVDMATLVKRSKAEGSPWYVRYYEVQANGTKKQRMVSTGTSDKATAKQIAKKYEAEAAVRQHRLIDPLEDSIRRQSLRHVNEHLADFRNKLKAAGRGNDHTKRTENYINEFFEHAAIRSIADIRADHATAWAASLRDTGMAARTIQARLTAIKSLTKWLANGDKLMRDPLTSVSKPNAREDRRRERRMLVPTEWPWLSRAAMAGEFRFEMTGVERCLLYRLAIQTGLRSSEIRSMGRGHFNLDDKNPFVRVASSSTKNAKSAFQHIDRSLADALRNHLSKKTPHAPAFSLPTEFEMADMLRADLADARQAWLHEANSDPDERAKREQSDFLLPINESGEALDFHALRHTCGAWLAQRGVQPKVIQSVMRHSTITLTLDTYGHLIAGAEAAAIASTADMTSVCEVLAATGTDALPATCSPIAHIPDASRCADNARACDETKDQGNNEGAKIMRFPYSELQPSATPCESVLQFADSLGAVAQWLELGTHNP